jgi:hypothetical protein
MQISLSTVAYLLKARAAEPQKQSFLGNGSETDNGTTSIAKQKILSKQKKTTAPTERLDKHVPAATIFYLLKCKKEHGGSMKYIFRFRSGSNN